MKLLLLFILLTGSLPVMSQMLAAVNEDSTQIRRFRPGQFVECVVTEQNRTFTLRGRLNLLYANSFLLETESRQWATVKLTDLVALRRVRRGWAEVLNDVSMPTTSIQTGLTVTAADMAVPALSAVGAVALTDPIRPNRYRVSIYQGWQFSVSAR
jgi:hypothetical protein